jgi:hypothetical protein
MTMSVAPVQAVAACRWSRHGYRVAGVPDELQRETLWVCVRADDRRCISAEECERCRYWEPRLTLPPQ